MKHTHIEQYNSPFSLNERQHYQHIIQQLTKENQMLKRQLETLIDHKHLSSDIQRAQTKEDDNNSNDIRKTQPYEDNTLTQKTNNQEKTTKSPIQQIVKLRQNQYKQMNFKASEYENKIQELSYFLKSAKQKQVIQEQQLSRSESESICFAKIVEIIEEVIKMFENDRTVLITKIQELLLLIATYDRKEREYLQRQRQFQLDLSIAQEQLVIFKRLKKTK